MLASSLPCVLATSPLRLVATSVHDLAALATGSRWLRCKSHSFLAHPFAWSHYLSGYVYIDRGGIQ